MRADLEPCIGHRELFDRKTTCTEESGRTRFSSSVPESGVCGGVCLAWSHEAADAAPAFRTGSTFST